MCSSLPAFVLASRAVHPVAKGYIVGYTAFVTDVKENGNMCIIRNGGLYSARWNSQRITLLCVVTCIVLKFVYTSIL